MLSAFRGWLIVLGLTCAAIGAAHLFIGQVTYIGGGEVTATMDSELRFFNVVFLAYGLAFVWAAQDVVGRTRVINVLGLVFFVGGVGRLLSWAVVGQPHWFFVVMMAPELLIPVANFFAVRALTARQP